MNKLAGMILDDGRRAFEKVDHRALEGKRILITGVSGLIGTHLLASLNCLRAREGIRSRLHGG